MRTDIPDISQQPIAAGKPADTRQRISGLNSGNMIKPYRTGSITNRNSTVSEPAPQKGPEILPSFFAGISPNRIQPPCMLYVTPIRVLV
jgi:hypothetical protein